VRRPPLSRPGRGRVVNPAAPDVLADLLPFRALAGRALAVRAPAARPPDVTTGPVVFAAAGATRPRAPRRRSTGAGDGARRRRLRRIGYRHRTAAGESADAAGRAGGGQGRATGHRPRPSLVVR